MEEIQKVQSLIARILRVDALSLNFWLSKTCFRPLPMNKTLNGIVCSIRRFFADKNLTDVNVRVLNPLDKGSDACLCIVAITLYVFALNRFPIFHRVLDVQMKEATITGIAFLRRNNKKKKPVL